MIDAPLPATADLLDEHPDARVIDLALASYGGRSHFAGRAATVSCVEDNVLLRQLLATPGEGRVVVVAGGGSRRTALLGDQMATLAADNGWAGLVLDAAVRDVAALAGIGVGIVALGSCPRRSDKRGTGVTEVPVVLGGISIRPGDLVVADEDGVVVLPAG
ncbi:MAG: ribonuclease E activity regulator RraA [Nocardioides sp.]|uniref:ribonuclease E activity regulator RraA n=1 Tax=Nocardioides sp. TaxID=35761 RepID=UPI0039E59F65